MANILANSTFSNFDIDSTSTIFDYDITLSANEWVGESSPYTYDLEFKDHKNMIDKIGINLGNNATNEQIAELQLANIMTANWVNNTTLRLIAYGENAPTLDIPIRLSIISVAIKFADDSSMLVFKDMVVSTNAWKLDSTYTAEGFGYSADIICPNVTEEYMPEVTFNVTDAACGNFSSNAATFDGIVRIYAREIPNEDIIVPTIICTIAAARLIGGSHAETHAKDGVDPITPEMIGAASTSQTYTKEEIDALIANNKPLSPGYIIFEEDGVFDPVALGIPVGTLLNITCVGGGGGSQGGGGNNLVGAAGGTGKNGVGKSGITGGGGSNGNGGDSYIGKGGTGQTTGTQISGLPAGGGGGYGGGAGGTGVYGPGGGGAGYNFSTYMPILRTIDESYCNGGKGNVTGTAGGPGGGTNGKGGSGCVYIGYYGDI